MTSNKVHWDIRALFRSLIHVRISIDTFERIYLIFFNMYRATIPVRSVLV